jgi:hypothetical protein
VDSKTGEKVNILLFRMLRLESEIIEKRAKLEKAEKTKGVIGSLKNLLSVDSGMDLKRSIEELQETESIYKKYLAGEIDRCNPDLINLLLAEECSFYQSTLLDDYQSNSCMVRLSTALCLQEYVGEEETFSCFYI